MKVKYFFNKIKNLIKLFFSKLEKLGPLVKKIVEMFKQIRLLILALCGYNSIYAKYILRFYDIDKVLPKIPISATADLIMSTPCLVYPKRSDPYPMITLYPAMTRAGEQIETDPVFLKIIPR